MSLRLSARALVAVSTLSVAVHAADYYVAPDGDDMAAGTEAAPFRTAQRAQQAASPGDTVYFRGGTYAFTGTSGDIGVLFDKSGQQGAPIRYFAYPGEVPVFDFFEFLPQARVRGFSVRGSWLHFKGLELRGVQQILTDVNESWCIRVENGASNNVFEALDLHHNEGPGLFLADGGNNLVLNVDSHHNWDPDRGGENADGFGCHTNDTGNVFRGCRAWYNSDDGFDFINAPGACVVEHSWAFYNGYQPDSTTAAGNGSGIKAGGFGLDQSTFPAVVPRHQVYFNVAFGNRASGFYANHHPGGIDWFHNTAFDNPRNFDLLADVGAADHYLRNNLALGGGLANATQSEIDDASNSWNLPVDVSEADFESVMQELAEAPRDADGNLPAVPLLRLVEGSDLIDQGEILDFPYEGEAPDLGAFEFGAPTPGVGTGGTGNAGTGGVGGAPAAGGAGGAPASGGGGVGGSGLAGTPSEPGAGAPAGGGPTSSPTPEPEPVAGAPGAAAGGPGTPSGPEPAPGSAGTSGVPVANPAGTPSSSAGAPGPSGSVLPPGPAGSGSQPPASDANDAGGCSCRVVTRASGGSGWLLLLVAALVRRRRPSPE